jgi:sugar phosphate isomerase/epimerase
MRGDRLVHVHANDNHGTWDDHLAPGDGDVDWPEVVSSLRGAGFSGWIVVELHCPGEDAERTFRRAVSQVRTLFGLYDLAGERA